MRRKKVILVSKWQIDFRIYACSCGLAFWSNKHFEEHLRDTKRWRKYHYAMDFRTNGHGFVYHLVHKKGNNINEAFSKGDVKNEFLCNKK